MRSTNDLKSTQPMFTVLLRSRSYLLTSSAVDALYSAARNGAETVTIDVVCHCPCERSRVAICPADIVSVIAHKDDLEGAKVLPFRTVA
jgi:deoxycytidylate deaminase